jgi:predicted HAD superfamily Cof-like phosphohydrolase
MSNIRPIKRKDIRKRMSPDGWALDTEDNVLIGPGGHEEPAPPLFELQERFDFDVRHFEDAHKHHGVHLKPRHNDQDMYADVRTFHRKMGQMPETAGPHLNHDKAQLRIDLMREELDETIAAIKDDDMPGIADGLADLIYVALGTAITYGIDLRGVWREVHRTNMEKQPGLERDDGKVLKPTGWQPPNIVDVLVRQGLIAEAQK